MNLLTILQSNSLPAIPARWWNLLFEPLPVVSETCTSTACSIPEIGAVLYLLVIVGMFKVSSTVVSRSNLGSSADTDPVPDDAFESDDDDGGAVSAVQEAKQAAIDESQSEAGGGNASEESEATANAETDEIPAGAGLDDVSELHQRTLAPGGIDRGFYDARVGHQYRRVLFAEGWPDTLTTRPLEHIFSDPTLQFDMSIHFQPQNRRSAIRDAERRADDLRAAASIQSESAGSGSTYAASDKEAEAQNMEQIREALKEGSRPFKTSMYVSIRADDEESLEQQEEQLVTKMRDSPGEISLTTIRGRQMQALQSVSPIGKDVLRKEGELDVSQVLLGGGVGSLLGSMNVSSELNPNGIEIGEHVGNGMPLIRDPFDSETNYNQVIIGDSGGGKSYDVKLQALREASRTDDKMIVMLDPLGGFHGVAEALKAQHVVVGGDRGLNPLEIQKPPQDAIDRIGEAFDPLSNKYVSALSFFDNYFRAQGFQDGLGEKRVILNDALVETYRRKGITHNVETHSKESPTIRDLREVLGHMANNPGEFDPANEQQKEVIAEQAGKLHTYLKPFVSGQYQNLGKQSEMDIKDEDFIYVDLEQQESSKGGGSGLMMQLLFQIIYERAKASEKEVIFIIDEAQYMLQDDASLEFLSQRVRHARHFDMSIRFATQNVKDFMRTDEATDIINNSYLTIFHRTREIHEFKDELNLSDTHANFIQDLRTGENYDHSHALFQINQNEYPVKIQALPAEDEVVSFDPDKQNRDELPGLRELSQESELVHNIRAYLNEWKEEAYEHSTLTNPAVPGEEFTGSVRTLDEEQQQALEAIGWEYLVEAIPRINNGEDPEKVLAEYLDKKIIDILRVSDHERVVERSAEMKNQTVATDGGDNLE
ncbi:VirB4 family type IV secretion system protein [Haloarcula sp. Atlit-7R]|uniref:VirB4 family type IV secretion system protein n=1 Tax=Haloarcula sp. Atlit-7R TaxID=2282125 RepID=UPI000EF14B18|nr:hypothetical protein [Haloarcula sp. Atlit-7R]RLM94334.1 hypothetical protein D3D01_15850 [Haloarcula sp. Atlit-7R]